MLIFALGIKGHYEEVYNRGCRGSVIDAFELQYDLRLRIRGVVFRGPGRNWNLRLNISGLRFFYAGKRYIKIIFS